MKNLLERIRILEEITDHLHDQSEYWMNEEHFDMEKSDRFEKEADEIYESLYRLFDEAAEKIVRLTSGQINKVMAMTMLRNRRAEIERIFA